MDKTILNFTPTGMIPMKKDTPYVPVTPEEIIFDVKKAVELGITMVHLHARDPVTQEPTYKSRVYAEIIYGIRAFAPDLVICVSTSGRTFKDFASRSDVLTLEGDLKPDMASLTLSSLNFNHEASVNSPDMVMALAKEMLHRGIKPELEVFDLGMANYAKYLIKKELLQPPYYANIILGNIACAQADLVHIGCIIRDMPEETLISLGGVGNAQLSVNSLAVSMGLGVRTGLEDNYWYDTKRTKLATNIEQIQRIKEIAQLNDKTFMTPCELRKRLQL